MEYCPTTLKKWLYTQNRGNSLTRNRLNALDKFHQVCKGVEYIHSKEIIHRDLKPDNILIARNGSIKIADFGIATDVPYQTHTEKQGTIVYRAPEQSGTKYDKMVDIFSLGRISVSLYSILCFPKYHFFFHLNEFII